MSDTDPVVHIVGLGPGPASLVTVETQRLLGPACRSSCGHGTIPRYKVFLSPAR